MKVNLKIIHNALQSNTIYTFNVILKILNIIITIIIQIAIWEAVFANGYKYNTGVLSIGLEQMKMYTILSTILSIFIGTNVIESINKKIKTGAIANDLIRPISFNALLLSETIGNILFNILTQLGVVVLIALFVYKLSFTSYSLSIFFVVSIINSGIIYYLISYCLGMMGFWYLEIWHLRRLLDGVIRVLSGAIIPLAFFPTVILSGIKYLPFRCLYDIPISIFINNYSWKYQFELIALQVIWIILLFSMQSLIYKKGIKKLVVQGG